MSHSVLSTKLQNKLQQKTMKYIKEKNSTNMCVCVSIYIYIFINERVVVL